ncbi:MAG: sulfite exporter TauE/SafE family protein [bacterium]
MIDIIILILMAFLASIISGVAGFGGALLLLPVLSSIIDIQSAIAILTICQIFGNCSRVAFGFKDLEWKPILIFLLGAIPLCILGSLFMVKSDTGLIKVIVGSFLIIFALSKRFFLKDKVINHKLFFVGGSVTGFLSGLVGSAGPLGAAFFLTLNLSAVSYIASEAFTALSIHIVKMIVYGNFLILSGKVLIYGLLLGITMIAGTWIARKIAEKLPKIVFMIIVEILLIILGISMIYSNL